MSYQNKRSVKRRILSTALLVLLMVIYIGIAPASRSSASPSKKAVAPCDCYSDAQQRDGVLRKVRVGTNPDGSPIFADFCDPVC